MLSKLNHRLRMSAAEAKINSQNSQVAGSRIEDFVQSFKTLNQQEEKKIINEEHRKATVDYKDRWKKNNNESPLKNPSKFMILRKKKYGNVNPSRNEGKIGYVQSLNNLQSRKYAIQEEGNERNVDYPDVHKRLARKIHEQWQMKRIQNQE